MITGFVTFLRLLRKATTVAKFGFVSAGMIAAPTAHAGSAKAIATTTTTAVTATRAASTTAGYSAMMVTQCAGHSVCKSPGVQVFRYASHPVFKKFIILVQSGFRRDMKGYDRWWFDENDDCCF